MSPGFHGYFFFNDTATTEIYTLSLHDALPIWARSRGSSAKNSRTHPLHAGGLRGVGRAAGTVHRAQPELRRSEEHTSELQSRQYLVCRLLLEKKNRTNAGSVSTARRVGPHTNA